MTDQNEIPASDNEKPSSDDKKPFAEREFVIWPLCLAFITGGVTVMGFISLNEGEMGFMAVYFFAAIMGVISSVIQNAR